MWLLKDLPEIKDRPVIVTIATLHHTRACTCTHTRMHTLTCTHTHTHAHSLAATCLPPHTYTIVAVYIDRLTMPKLMICTGGDEFFQPDDSIFYWDQLKEPKFIR